jgi:type 1 glutamine amidotransferase
MRRVLLFGVLAFGVACGSSPAPMAPGPPAVGGTPNPSTTPIRVLVLTATAGFRHDDAIKAAGPALVQIALNNLGEFLFTQTENLADIRADTLINYNVIFFACTTGELAFTDAQKAAIVNFVEQGGGFMGAHSATDTLYDWADYGRIVGAYFKEHPWTQEATVTVEDTSHPATRALPASFRLFEEYYTFRDNPRPRVHVLLSLNTASVGAQGDYPLAWTQTIGQGRSFYTALGHFAGTWNDPRFRDHLVGAIRWVAKRD